MSHNPPMQWTEPAGELLVIESRRGAGSATDRPYVMQRDRAMAEPLDYRNPNMPSEPDRSPPAPRQAIPADFDTLLTQTADHAAAKAIESALRHAKIRVYAAASGSRVVRLVEFYVRAADHERASQIAAQIFARRQKLRSHPRQQMPEDDRPGSPDTPGVGDFSL